MDHSKSMLARVEARRFSESSPETNEMEQSWGCVCLFRKTWKIFSFSLNFYHGVNIS